MNTEQARTAVPNLLCLDSPQADGDQTSAPTSTAFHRLSPTSLGEADFIFTRATDIDAGMIGRAERCLAIVHLGPGARPGAPRVDVEAARAAGIYVASIPDPATGAWAGRQSAQIERLAGTAGLRGRRLGLLGLGEVGMAVARRAAEAGAELWGYDPFCPPNNFDILGVQAAPLDELLGIAQILAVQVPLGPATRGLLDAGRLDRLQRGSALALVGAPELLDLAALGRGLRLGRPAAAAIASDAPAEAAWRRETDFPGLEIDPDPITPTAEDERRAFERAVEIARQVWHGRRPPHLLIDPACPRQSPGDATLIPE